MLSAESLLFVTAVAGAAYIVTPAKHRRLVAYRLKFTTIYLMYHFVAFICLPFFLIRLDHEKISLYTAAVYQFVARPLKLQWSVRGKHHLKLQEAVIVANHQSIIDLMAFPYLGFFHGRVVAIARKEVFYYWPFGLWAWLYGLVFIDKSNPAKAYKQLEDAAKAMKKNKHKLLIFPEGLRNHKREFLPFKKGGFMMALSTGVPIIPMIISPYYFLNREKRIFGEGKVLIEFMEPIPTTGLTVEDADKLAEEVREKMYEKFKELAHEMTSNLPEDYPLEPKWRFPPKEITQPMDAAMQLQM